jgi:hypothetical protein
MAIHVLASVGYVTAECAPQAASQSPSWLQVIQATGSIATAVGVLIALYIAVIRDPREATAAHDHRVARMEALHHAMTQRFGAQARKLVPSCARTPMLGDSWWAVRIDNASNRVTTLLDVNVVAIDTDGVEVPRGCRRVSKAIPADPVVDRSIRSALSDSLESALDRPLTGAIRQAIRDAVAVHFVNEWPRSLPPNHHAVMCYTTVDARYRLSVTIDYEDEAGFQWRRTDTRQPRRTDDLDIESATTNSTW